MIKSYDLAVKEKGERLQLFNCRCNIRKPGCVVLCISREQSNAGAFFVREQSIPVVLFFVNLVVGVKGLTHQRGEHWPHTKRYSRSARHPVCCGKYCFRITSKIPCVYFYPSPRRKFRIGSAGITARSGPPGSQGPRQKGAKSIDDPPTGLPDASSKGRRLKSRTKSLQSEPSLSRSSRVTLLLMEVFGLGLEKEPLEHLVESAKHLFFRNSHVKLRPLHNGVRRLCYSIGQFGLAAPAQTFDQPCLHFSLCVSGRGRRLLSFADRGTICSRIKICR